MKVGAAVTCSRKCLSEWRSRYALKHADSPTDRFWSKVEKTDGCWLWTGGTTAFGYGVFTVSGRRSARKQDGAHRYSWTLHFGSIPEDLCVLHRCDNPACVRPEHLFLGTKQDNALDCQRKGRGFARQTHCKHGHEMTAANTYTAPNGNRFCRECGRRSNRAWETRTKRWLTRHRNTRSA